jgi:Zn-finger protein
MGQKVCARCKTERPLSQFRWKNKTRGERISYCSPCDKIVRAERYKVNRDRLRQQQEESIRRKRELVARTGLHEPESKVCIDCCESKPIIEFRWRD